MSYTRICQALDDGVPHRVNNDADTWRIHLLLDFAEAGPGRNSSKYPYLPLRQ